MNRYLFEIGRCVVWATVAVWLTVRIAAQSLSQLVPPQLLYGIVTGAPLLIGVGGILIAVAGHRAAFTDERLTRRAVRHAVVISMLALGAWWHSLSLYGVYRASPFAFVPLATLAGTGVGGLILLFRHRLLDALLAYALLALAQFPWHFFYADWWSQPGPVLQKALVSLLGFGWAAALFGMANSYRNALLVRSESPSVTT